MTIPSCLTYCARPVNGGHLDHALPKVGDWSAEPKDNGWRDLIHVPSGTHFNRKGERLTIAGEFDAALAILKRTPFVWCDCEALERRHKIGQGTLILLDLPDHPGTYLERVAAMRDGNRNGIGYLRTGMTPMPNCVYLSPVYSWGDARYIWDLLQDENKRLGCDFYEGLVAKENKSRYYVQLQNPESKCRTWIKHRFI